LGQDGVFRVAEKRFDIEVLLDEPKEDFDLPALLVDVCDGTSWQRHVVGQKLEALPGFLIPVANSAQDQGLLCFTDLDDLIGGDTRCPICGVALNDDEASVALDAGDHKNTTFTQLPEPCVIDVAPVEDHDGALRQLQELSDVDLVAFGFGDGDDSREIAVMVQEGVQFDAARGGPELGPGEQGKAQVNNRGVETEQFVFK